MLSFKQKIVITKRHKLFYWFLRFFDISLTFLAIGIIGTYKESNPFMAFIINNFGWFVTIFINLVLSYYAYHVGIKFKNKFYWGFLISLNYFVVTFNLIQIIIMETFKYI